MPLTEVGMHHGNDSSTSLKRDHRATISAEQGLLTYISGPSMTPAHVPDLPPVLPRTSLLRGADCSRTLRSGTLQRACVSFVSAINETRRFQGSGKPGSFNRSGLQVLRCTASQNFVLAGHSRSLVRQVSPSKSEKISVLDKNLSRQPASRHITTL